MPGPDSDTGKAPTLLHFSFMPSDFHPHLLVLGEGADLDRLAQTLHALAGGAPEVDLVSFAASPDTRLKITSAPGPRGVHPAGADRYDLVWRLDRDEALGFAARLSDLADDAQLSGSEHLDCTVADAIPVWVSKGEFAAGFLET